MQYFFHFALLIEGVRRGNADDNQAEEFRIPVVVRDEEARSFLKGFHPKDVRKREFSMDRLKQRLVPILGSELVYGTKSHAYSQEQRPLPFQLVVNASIKKKSDGTVLQRFHLVGTRVDKHVNHVHH